MNFILYINCTDKEAIQYENSVSMEIKKMGILADFLDIDSFSDAHLITYAQKALEESSKASVIFKIEPNGDYKPFISIIHFLLDYPTKFTIFVNGTDSIIYKMLPPAEGFIFHQLTSEQQLHIISIFFNR